MAKTYTIHYSKKYAMRAGGNNLYSQSSPESYFAGTNGNYNYGVVCFFSGLNNINANNVTSITLYLQRIVGGTNVTYSVDLYQSVLTNNLVESGDQLILRTGYPDFVDNREVFTWDGNDTDVGGEYRQISIPASLFNSLKTYGWAVAFRSNVLARVINVGDVYLVVSTNETDYTLSYNANGGSGAPASQTGTGVGGYNFLISTTRPSRTGYTFRGWSLTKTATTASYQPGDTIRITSNSTLYAVWTANTYQVTFNPNGGQVSPTYKTVTYASTYGSLPTPTRLGYRFDGWFTAATGGSKIASTTIVTALSNHTVYAHWTVQSVVHVYKNGLYTGTVHVKGKDNTMHLGIVYCKGSDNKLHINA